MLPSGRALRRKALCEYGLWVPWQWTGIGTGGLTARLTARPLPSLGLRPSFAVLLLLSATWLLALLSVNSDTLLFHYLFAASNCIQVPGPTHALWEARGIVGGKLGYEVP